VNASAAGPPWSRESAAALDGSRTPAIGPLVPLEAADPRILAVTAAGQIAEATGVARHDVAVVLGSGWAQAADRLGETVATLPASAVAGFPGTAVAGHLDAIRSVRGPGPTARRVLVLGARAHLYQGLGAAAVAHGVRTAAACGCTVVVLTNGCGGLDPDRPPGTPVLISDHINLTGVSPVLDGRFLDLTDLYSPRLRDLARAVAPDLAEGVYVQFPGPHYETPAEVRMAGILGGSLVGMSTALEAIAAREAGLEVLGLSLVTNLAAGISPTPLRHEEVVAAGQAAADRSAALLAGVLAVL